MRPNIYAGWKKNNELNNKLELIKKLASLGAGEQAIADKLGICKRTLINMKNIHQDVAAALDSGRDVLKGNLIEVTLKKAMGFKIVDENQNIEETSRGTRKRITKSIKEIPPDLSAIKYLLVLFFGKEYSDKRYELELMEKRIEKGMEEWSNADRLQEDK